jgi:hypothetical protein
MVMLRFECTLNMNPDRVFEWRSLDNTLSKPIKQVVQWSMVMDSTMTRKEHIAVLQAHMGA